MDTKKKLRWNQTPEGRQRMSEIMKKRQADKRNGKTKVKKVPLKHQELVALAILGAQAELERMEHRRVTLRMFLKGVR